MMPRMHSTAIPGASSMSTERSSARVSRRARVRAVAVDLLLCAGIQVAFGAIAFLLFVVSTGGGARDLATSTATLGWSIALAAVPAWLGLLGHASAVLDGTPGQRSAGLTVEGFPARRAVRLAVHPVSALGWLWLALVAALAAVPGLPFLLTAAGLIAIGGGVVSTVMLLLDPSALPLHDRLAGTRLVAR
jgi:hypothetical protein